MLTLNGLFLNRVTLIHLGKGARGLKTFNSQKNEFQRMKSTTRTENSTSVSTAQLSAKDLLVFFDKRGLTPISVKELMDALNVPNNDKRVLTDLLDTLAATGIIAKLKRKRYARCSKFDWAIGIIRFLSNGNAVVAGDKTSTDVFIRRRKTAAAVTGDEVIVSLNRRGRYNSENSVMGEVIGVISRNRPTVVGTLEKTRFGYSVEPQGPNVGPGIYIQNPHVAKLGDRVVVELSCDNYARTYPSGQITEVIGPFDEPALDTTSVIKAYELPTCFPEEVIEQAESVKITKSAMIGRLDLQNKFVFTVDPVTARDFDDALSLEKMEDRQWLLGVHIADVSHFIPAGSALDKEASQRGNSVYFPDAVIPMLPEHLSNGICSLKNDVCRLTISTLITLDNNGTPLNVEFRESVIRSRCRLNYRQVQSVLDLPTGGAAAPDVGLDKSAVSTLKQLNKLAQTLRKRRFESGALNMTIPEVQFSIGPNGRIDGITPVQNNESHQLVEECMLLANEMVCKELTRKGIPHLYRIHEMPDPEKLQELEELLDIAGLRVGDLTLRKNLCNLLSTIAELPHAHAWNTAILRSMRKAEYSERGIGHYGLAKQHYTHFTSPIRRYSDLVMHRILKSYLQKRKSIYTKSRLSEIAKLCSERELIATQAARDVNELKIFRYFHEQLKTGNLEEYEAVVVDVRKHGLFIDIPEVQAYGMIHKSLLGTKTYFDSGKKQFFSRGKNAKVFKIGLSLKVAIARVDLNKRYLDFAPV